jgi:hypothetical protein
MSSILRKYKPDLRLEMLTEIELLSKLFIISISHFLPNISYKEIFEFE